eukprot:14748743-Alexandrium_andersonii.AAC.1
MVAGVSAGACAKLRWAEPSPQHRGPALPDQGGPERRGLGVVYGVPLGQGSRLSPRTARPRPSSSETLVGT